METKENQEYTALGALEKCIFNLGRKVEKGTLRREHPNMWDQSIQWVNLERLAKDYKMRGKVQKIGIDELREVPAPAIAKLKNGQYVMLGAHNDESVMFLDIARDKAVALPTSKFGEVWTGEVMTITARLNWEEIKHRFNLEWFWRVIKRYKHVLIEILLASAFFQAMGIMMPLFTQVIIDKVVGNGGLSTLTVLGVAMVVLALVQAMLSGVRTHILNQTTTKLDAILGANLFRHLISLPVPYYEHRRVGDTIMRVNMVGSVRQFLTGTSMTALLDAVFSVTFVAVMLYYSVGLTIIALVIIPLYVFQTYWAFPIYWDKMMRAMAMTMQQRNFLIEAVTGMQTVKALAIEPQFIKRWESLVCRHIQRQFDMAAFNLLITGGNGAIQLVSTLVILWVGGYKVMNGEFTLGQLIAFQMLAGQAIGPLTKLLTMWPDIQRAVLGMRMLGDVLHSRIEPVLMPSPPGLKVIRGDIEVKDVSFRYRLDLPPAVDGVSFSIKAGEKIGLVGRSGSGKSTLAGLLEKIYMADEGSITVDGTDLREADYPWLRNQMGVVQQDSYLYNGSIRDNIAAGKPAASMEEVIRAAQLAGAHEFILELDEGYDTKVGERGASLSGGQRQRIAIARALLTNPRIMIFDEATSALDYESERVVMKNIEAIGQGRTMIFIAHRLVTVEHCDRIIVLDHGKVAEQGTPAELLALGGIYAHLHAQQSVE
ncbi:peptidase domain-containing ABC transporter [Selenomonas sp. AB3002]|uniref:peptidase domain-containing ABC transporter n=1 Tax=Selenomonas sp. AB3002 TaxID=1392502 RepID=UPI000691F467